MSATTAIGWSPLLPWSVLGPLFGVLALLLLAGLLRRARGMLWRALAMAAIALALVNPALVEEERQPIDDVAAIVVDRSPSQALGERTARTDQALAALRAELARQPGLDVRVVEAGGGGEQVIDETRLMAAAEQAVGDVPRRRVAGILLLTDGQVHDVPADPAAALAGLGPVHTLLTGERDEADRRLSIRQAPSFGLVGRTVTVTVRVDDLPAHGGSGGTAVVTLHQDGTAAHAVRVPVGADTDIAVTLDHGGPTVVELEVEPAAQELSLANNRAAVVINGVRDRLRVLLVSGEPHAGERTWRNILKSDPSVDLVHFTILRPPEREDGTPINELSLISFPIRELFELRLHEFDLVIFDRYRRRAVLPNLYLGNIAHYVEGGGAYLEASGPDFADATSLYRTPLGAVLPGEPTGRVLEGGFRPEVTALGRRHPVTEGLEGAGGDGTPPSWGRWFRQVDVHANAGSVVMAGAEGRPLLILNRVGQGRVAQLTSDHIWLWNRGFEGGGPQAELLRRLAHWLMKEPELEENDLRAQAAGRRVRIERRSLDEAARPVTVTTPSGRTDTVDLTDESPGHAAGVYQASEPGIFRISDGDRTAVAVVGTLNPPELADMRTTDERLRPVAEATQGGTYWLTDGVPAIRRVRPDRDLSGQDWLGLRANGDFTVTGVRELPLLPVWATLLLAIGGLMAAWRREGR